MNLLKQLVDFCLCFGVIFNMISANHILLLFHEGEFCLLLHLINFNQNKKTHYNHEPLLARQSLEEVFDPNEDGQISMEEFYKTLAQEF